MILLKIIYKPILLMFFLLFNFSLAMGKLLAKLSSFFWAIFIWLVIAILVYTAMHQQWQEFIIAFCIGFASYLGASVIMGLGFMADWINEKMMELLVA